MTIGSRRVSVVAAVLSFLVPLGAATPVRAATAGSVTINSVSQPEGDAGSRHMTFGHPQRRHRSLRGRLRHQRHQLGDETFAVELTNPTNSVSLGGAATGTGTIVDDDAPPSISITGPSIGEGNAGRSPATFVASLSAPSGRAVTVQVATADGSATAPGDYAGTTGTVTDDENPPSVSIAPVAVTVPEGNRGPSTRTLDVTLSAPSATTVTVDAATADGTATSGRTTPPFRPRP
jgi:hypothetical protein